VKGYEQIEFEETKKISNLDNYREKCFDCNGDEIKEGDYVIPIYGEARKSGIEGYVEEIIYAECMTYIKIVTSGRKLLQAMANPFQFAVVKKWDENSGMYCWSFSYHICLKKALF